MILGRVALVTLFLSAAGCTGLERSNECRAIAKVVNPVLSDIDHQRTDTHGATYRAISAKYEALANATGQIKVRTKRVAEALNDYQHALHEAARDARAFSDALDAKDDTRIGLARIGATRTVRHEATALARFDNACRAVR